MLYYALQVRTNEEDAFVQRAQSSLEKTPGRFLVPKRVLDIRKGGIVKKNQIFTVFPGYVFFETEHDGRDLFWIFHKVEGFYRMLRDNQNPTPLSSHDKELLLHFISFGERADKSKVTFDENDHIVIVEGPLKGLEGNIIKVDKRKCRAEVILDLYDSSFKINLGFEEVGKAREGDASSNVKL